MTNIELRHLHYFITVAEELNFGRAALRLHMAQPPLTRQIRQLEEEIGVKLFYRTTRRMELTEAGRVFLTEAQRILVQVQEGIHLAQLAERGQVGQLVVGFEGSSAYDIVPLAVKAFRTRFPDVNLVVRELTTGDQLEALHKAQIGIGFVALPLGNTTDLVVETVLQEPLVVALPASHFLATHVEIEIASLQEEAFILCPRQYKCGLFDHVISVCHQAGFSPALVQETNEIQSILGFVAAGLGVALLPASVKHLQRSDIVYRFLQPPVPKLALAIAWRRDNTSPLLSGFIQVVRGLNYLIPGETKPKNFAESDSKSTYQSVGEYE